jgi:ATP-binding cassette subfamily B protein
MGVPNATYDDMLLASKAADAHEFINAIPEQYESHVARKGADFSGGQRQRISIARSLILKPKILILDDSTSACDVATEARIQDEVDVLMKDSTQLIVAQRISSVITADKIVLMDKGEIVAMGAHEKLLKTSALYQEIYNSQLKSGISGSKVRL